ncbi:MAG: zinc-binding dehydrogenase, partial [Cephaloticoccus sp.]
VGQLSAKPEHLNWAEAAALPLAGLTAWRAVMSRARLHPDERVLVSGIGGGVALFALQIAAVHDAKVWVTSSSSAKIARAVEWGAQGGFDYTADGWAKEAAREVGGFDVILDGAGGAGVDQLIDAAAPGARLVFYGATRGNVPELALRKIFWRQLSVLGTTMGNPADWSALLAFVASHRLQPVVSDTFTLARADDAFALMERGGQMGKIVLTIGE